VYERNGGATLENLVEGTRNIMTQTVTTNTSFVREKFPKILADSVFVLGAFTFFRQLVAAHTSFLPFESFVFFYLFVVIE
jgi:hypothetical protein